MEDEGDVLPGEHVIEEGVAGVALVGEDCSLAHAGVNKQAERERHVCLDNEMGDGLRAAVFV